jgi:hypothetical protein
MNADWDSKAFFQKYEQVMTLARKKHPFYAEGKYQALGVIGEEYEEFVKAIEKESELRSIEEAWDVIATCTRFIVGEHRLQGEKRGFGWEKRL